MGSDAYVSYVLANFFAIFECKLPLPTIGYGSSEAKILVLNRATDFFETKQLISPQKVIWKTWKGTSVPFLFGNPETPIFTQENGQLIIHDDIFASSFYFLSGWQETIIAQRDSAGRFLYEYSIQKELQIAHLPVVNIYFDILKTAIEEAYGITLVSKLEKPIAFISHDIDEWAKIWRYKTKKSIRARDWLELYHTLILRISGKHLEESFSPLLKLQEKYRFRSSFYFLAETRKFGNFTNADYEMAEPQIKSIIRSIQSRGNEIGLHGSFFVHSDMGQLSKEFAKIRSKPVGYRSHYLLFDVEKTPVLLEEEGIRYDTSLGFPDQIGWRNSCSYPFYLYDYEKNCASSVLEIPLAIMECTLFFEKYLGLDSMVATQKCLEYIQIVEKHGGIISFLWHNTAFDPYLYPGWANVLENILIELNERKIPILRGSEVAEGIHPYGQRTNL